MNENTITVTVTGNLIRDPELRFTSFGHRPTATFGIAVNRRFPNRQTGTLEDIVSFFDVVSWGALAENVGEALRKGDRVVVVGRLDQHRWEAEGGEKRSKIEITASEVAASLRWAAVEIIKNERRPQEPAMATAQGAAGNAECPEGEEPF